ncbi:MAG TPA: NAD-dependent epimerase/dehydratase family protein [Thermoanaerobaculia bacterium]
MKVFVTGATGYIGRAVLTALHRAGHSAVGLAREKERAAAAPGPCREWVIGNLRDARTYAFEASACDAILHLGADMSSFATVDKISLETLLSAAAKGDGKKVFVYTSGVWVLGATGKTPVDEDSALNPVPLIAARVRHEQLALGASSDQLTAAVVRPGIVYGGRGGIVSGFFADAVSNGRPTVVGDGNNRWAGVYLGDLCDLYLRLLESAFSPAVRRLAPKERIFHAVTPPSETVSSIARAASRAAGREDTVHFWPLEEAREKLGGYADALALDQVVGSKRSEAVLGWRPRVRGFVPNAPELFEEWRAGV